MTNMSFDAEPEPTFWGDLIGAGCLLAVFLSAAGLGWYVFGALRDLVLS